jgi:branched-chain amino acid transport system ATP-binding protein
MQMSAAENILLVLEKQLVSSKERVEEVLEKISLSDMRNEQVGKMSYGEQKLLSIGCSIANDTDLLLLDEPVTDVDNDHLLKIISLIKQLKQDGKTILQVEHHADYILATSDRIFQIKKGGTIE